MSGIDSSIYQLAGRGVKSVADYDNEASQAKQNKLAEMMGGMKMQEFQTGIERTGRLNSLLGAFKPDATADDQVGQLTRGGFLTEARSLAESSSKVAKEKRDAEKAQLESTSQKLALGAQLLGGVTDQASYDAARATAQASGLDVSRMQPNYDPAFVAQKVQEGRTVKEQLDQYWKKQGYDLDVQKVNETGRHNRTTEGLTANGQQIQIRGQNMVEGRAAQSHGLSRERLEFEKTKPGATGAPAKPLPVAALKLRGEAQDAADTAEGINERLGVVEKRIVDKKLSFGPVSNLANSALNATGMSTEGSRNLASFKSDMEKLRNDSLRLNKGVQTDGDAQRAWNELFQNINDTKLVQQRLTEIKQINARAKNLRLLEVDTINRNYGGTSEATTMKPAPASVDSLLEKYK